MTAIYVTHDQEEALAISDRIAIMAKGQIEQLDYPEEIYRNPRTVFAASFVGTSNHFKGKLTSPSAGICQVAGSTLRIPDTTGLSENTQVLVLVRPEEITLQAAERASNMIDAPTNALTGTIELRTFLGSFTRFHVRVDAQLTLLVDVPSQQARDLAVAQSVLAHFPPAACQVLALEEESVAQEQAGPTGYATSAPNRNVPR